MLAKLARIVLTSVMLSVVFLMTSGVGSAWAGFPERSIRLIVPFSPGGQSDQLARILSRFANPYLDGKIYVENVLGATGAIGWREAAKAAPDGYTLTLLSSSLFSAPNTIKGFPTYDLFDPICLTVAQYGLILTKYDGRFKTIQDVIAYAKAHPGEIKAANSGFGGYTHMGTAGFERAIGIKLTHVPYKGGSEASIATMGGHVDINMETISATVAHVEGKKLRPLIALGPERFRRYPDVPTPKDLGYDYSVASCIGIIGPKGMPEDVKKTLVAAFKKATENEEYKKIMVQVGLQDESVFWGPSESDVFFKKNVEFYRDLATQIGLKAK